MATEIPSKQSLSYLHEHDIIIFKNTSYSFKNENAVEIAQVKTTKFGLHSFRYGGTTLWNELPDNIRKETSLVQFKSLINNWNGSLCKCGSYKSWKFGSIICILITPAMLEVVWQAIFWLGAILTEFQPLTLYEYILLA